MEVFSFFGQRLGYAQLVGMGVHVGHSEVNSSVYAAWMVYGYRSGVCLIDLFKFVTMLRYGFSIIDFMVALGRPLWFVNKDKSFARYVRYYALKCGEFSSTLRWIRGMLSNFRVVGRLAKKHLLLSSVARGRRLLRLDTTLSQWFLTRYTWPGLVFVSSVTLNYFVVNETFSCEIPCMGIADSDALVQGCSVAVPGNDDSLDSVVFYHDLVAEYVLYRKFSQVYLWFLHIRRSKRLLGFQDWLFLKKDALVALDLGFFFSSQVLQKYAFGKLVLGFFFGQGSWSNAIAEQIKVYRAKDFFDIGGSLDAHELVVGRYFYLFSFFFFRRLGLRRGRFLLSPRSRRYVRRRYRYRLNDFRFTQKNMQRGSFKFPPIFKYLGQLYSFRKGSLPYRRFLLRFVHYYFFFYYLYFHTLQKHRAAFRRPRLKALRRQSRRRVRREYRLYWRFFRRFFSRHWNYESTIRLATRRQRSRLLRRRFGIFQLLFKLYHEPMVKGIMLRRVAQARKGKPKNKNQRYVRVSHFIRIRFARWRRWYRAAARKFFSRRRLRRHYFFNLVIPRLALTSPGPVFGRARKRQSKVPNKPPRPVLLRWRRRLLARLHGAVARKAQGFRRKLSRRFRFTPFYRALKRAILRIMVYGFFSPMALEDSLFLSPGSFYREPVAPRALGLQAGTRAPRKLQRFYNLGGRSLVFRGRKRKFFIGYIAFGRGAQALQQMVSAYDFSLGHLKLPLVFPRVRRGQFFLARGRFKAKAPGPRSQGWALEQSYL